MPTRGQECAFLVYALAVVISGCGRSSGPDDPGQKRSFAYRERVGLAKWHDNRGCLALFNPSIALQTKVGLVEQPPFTESPSVKEAIVVERLAQACDTALSGSNNDGVGPSFYQIAIADGTTSPNGIVFAIPDPPRPIVVRDGRVEADLDGDGVAESFRTCNSTETLHFMVWTGPPAQGRPRWHGYYSVGSDMVPSCTEQDVAAIVDLQRQ